MTSDIIRTYYNYMPHRIQLTVMCRDLTGVLAAAGLKVCLSALCYAVFDNDIKDRAVNVSVNDICMNSSFQTFVAMEFFFYRYLKRSFSVSCKISSTVP